MKHEPKPIADGPLWPWVKVVDELATELGHVVTKANIAPYAGYCGTFLHLRFASSIEVMVLSDSSVMFEREPSPGETHATYRWVSVDASVSTPAELIPVLRQLLASAAKPTPEYIAKLERIRSEIK